MKFPEKFAETINNSKDRPDRLIELLMVYPNSSKPNRNLVSWKVVETSETKIVIELEFSKPLEVSQGTPRDLLYCSFFLSQFEDENG